MTPLQQTALDFCRESLQPSGVPSRLISNAKAHKRIVNELYQRFGGSCYRCKTQLDINGSGIYPTPVIVVIPGVRHPRQLACDGCAPGRATPPAERRKLLKGATLLPFIQRLFEQSSGCCVYCGGPVRLISGGKFPHDRATVDHVVPRSRGGAKTFDNLALACFACNNLKGDMTPLEMLRAFFVVVSATANRKLKGISHD